MKSVEESGVGAKKKADKNALRELATQVKEWKREQKSSPTEDTIKSPFRAKLTQPHLSSNPNITKGKEPQRSQRPMIVPHSLDQEISPKTLQRIDAGKQFKVLRDNSQAESNEDMTIEHELNEREPKYHAFTMGNTAIQSRGSPQRNMDKMMYSPTTLSELYFTKSSTIVKEPSFSKFCEAVNIKNQANDYSVKKSSKEFSNSQSPYTVNRFSMTEELMRDHLHSPRSGSGVAKKYESAAGMQEEINRHLQVKIDYLTHENTRLKDSNDQYKEEIALLGRRIESLALQMTNESMGEEESICSQCRCGRKVELEAQARQIKKLEQANFNLEAKLKLSVVHPTSPESPSKDSSGWDASPGEIATSRLRNSKRDALLEIEKKKALADLAALTSRFEALERENVVLKQSRYS